MTVKEVNELVGKINETVNDLEEVGNLTTDRVSATKIAAAINLFIDIKNHFLELDVTM